MRAAVWGSLLAVAGCGDNVAAPDGQDIAARLVIDRQQVDLGAVIAGVTSAPAALTITNTGGAPTGALSARVAGAGWRATSDTCQDLALAPGASCEVDVAVTTSGTGAYPGTFTVSSTPGGDVGAALTATAVSPRGARLVGSPAADSFGLIEIGTASAGAVTWTITNLGGLATTMPALTMSTPELTSAASTCTAPLPPRRSCSIALRFTPAAGGPRGGRATLTVDGSSASIDVGAVGGWPVTVERHGDAGTVMSAPAGLACAPPAGSCTALLPPGPVTLQARTTNGSGFYFSSWSGPSAGACAAGPGRDCELVVDGPEAIAATFSPITANLSFVTDDLLSTNLGGVAPYDAACNAAAAAAGINSGARSAYVAWISSSTSLAMDRLAPASGWVRLDGRVFAASYDGLIALGEALGNQVLNPVRYSETGAELAVDTHYVTGTWHAGPSSSFNCNDWTTNQGDHQVLVGHVGGGPFHWTAGNISPCGPGHLLCLMRVFTTGTTAARTPGKQVWLSNGGFSVGSGATPDATCDADRPAGVTEGRALIATTTRSAASLLTATQMYVRPDGQEVGTGAELAAGHNRANLWQSGDGTYVGANVVWTGSPAIDQLGTAISTCGDWSDPTAPRGLIGNDSSSGVEAWHYAAWADCGSSLRLYCYEP